MFIFCVSSDHVYEFYQEMGTLGFWLFQKGTCLFPEDLREEEKKFLPSVVLAGDSGVFTPETPVSTHRRLRFISGPSPVTLP